MTRSVRAAMLVVAMVVVLGVAATFLPEVVWPDRPAPPSLEASLASARRQLSAEAVNELWLPRHFTFVEARCASDGSVAMIFEEHRPPYLESQFAYVARGSAPTAVDSAWSGGFGIAGSVLTDGEFVYLMGRDTKPCEG